MQILRHAFKTGAVSHVKQAGNFAPSAPFGQGRRSWLATQERVASHPSAIICDRHVCGWCRLSAIRYPSMFPAAIPQVYEASGRDANLRNGRKHVRTGAGASHGMLGGAKTGWLPADNVPWPCLDPFLNHDRVCDFGMRPLVLSSKRMRLMSFINLSNELRARNAGMSARSLPLHSDEA